MDEAGSQAASADQNALNRAVDERANGLEVGSKDSFHFIIGMTDVMSAHTFFPTN